MMPALRASEPDRNMSGPPKTAAIVRMAPAIGFRTIGETNDWVRADIYAGWTQSPFAPH